MKKLIKFELIQRKKYLIIIALMIIITSWYLIMMNDFEQVSLNYLTSSYEIEQIENDDEFYEIERDFYRARKNNDSNLYLETKIKENEYYLSNHTVGGNETRQYYQNENSFNQYLIENNIDTMNMINTSYNKLESINGVSSIYQATSNIILILMPLITLLISCLVFYLKPVTYNYYMTLPYPKNRLLQSKWITAFIINIVILLSTVITAFIIGTIIGGVGDFRYPIVTNYLNINDTSQTIISFYLYLPLVLIVAAVKIAFYTTLGMLFIYIVKNKWISLLISGFIGIVPAVYFLSLDYTYHSNLIPFVFDNSHALITYGYSPLTLVSYFIGIIILGYFCIYISKKLF